MLQSCKIRTVIPIEGRAKSEEMYVGCCLTEYYAFGVVVCPHNGNVILNCSPCLPIQVGIDAILRDRIIGETTAAFVAGAFGGGCGKTAELRGALIGNNAFLVVVEGLVAKITLLARTSAAVTFSFLDFLAIDNSAHAVEGID